MNRSEYVAMAKDVKEHPERLAEYRKIYKNVYPFSDGFFKMLMANAAKSERTVKFLNAMLGLEGKNAITEFTLGVPENPGVLNDNPDREPVSDGTVHHAQLVRNRHMYYEKMDIYLIEIEKFFAIEDRTPPEERELPDKDFVKDVSLEEYTDETLLNEVDGMTNILYEKQGSYLQGQEDMVKAMLAEGVSVDIVMRVSKFSEEKILKLQAEIAREKTTA